MLARQGSAGQGHLLLVTGMCVVELTVAVTLGRVAVCHETWEETFVGRTDTQMSSFGSRPDFVCQSSAVATVLCPPPFWNEMEPGICLPLLQRPQTSCLLLCHCCGLEGMAFLKDNKGKFSADL